MLQEALGYNAMSQSKTFLCTAASRTDERLSTTTTVDRHNIGKVSEGILADRRQTTHDVFQIVGLSYGTVQRILADNLNMGLFSRFVLRVLSDDQKATIPVCGYADV